jgi:flagellar hook-basal body complex protein FliE
MKKKKNSGLIPDAAALDKSDLVALFVDKKGFIERTLRDATCSFGRTLNQAAKDVNLLQSETGKAVNKLAVGEKVDLNEVMVAVEKARASFNQLTEIRNKMMDAYREILKMQK